VSFAILDPLNCTITFDLTNSTGNFNNTWFGVAIQVEDFYNSTTTTPFSSVPAQFLINVETIPVIGCELS
jgi:hypothetical protein